MRYRWQLCQNILNKSRILFSFFVHLIFSFKTCVTCNSFPLFETLKMANIHTINHNIASYIERFFFSTTQHICFTKVNILLPPEHNAEEICLAHGNYLFLFWPLTLWRVIYEVFIRFIIIMLLPEELMLKVYFSKFCGVLFLT